MDQRGEKEHHSSQLDDSSDYLRKRTAAAVPEGINGESTDRRDDGGYEAETAGVIKEQAEVEVEVVEEEEASAPLLARPCSLLQLLLRACAGCLVSLLHGYCSDYNDPKPAANDVAGAAVAESSPQEVEGGGDDVETAAGVSEVATQVLPPPPPGPPIEGSGDHGGSHN